MLAGVPAPDRQVEPAGEGNRVVDHDDLLMLGGSQRKAGVQAKPNSAVTVRGELVCGTPFPLGCIQRREIPDQDVDPERPFELEQTTRNAPSSTGNPSSARPDGPTNGVLL